MSCLNVAQTTSNSNRSQVPIGMVLLLMITEWFWLSHGFFCNLCHNTWGLCNLFLFGSFNLSHGNKEKSILGAELMMCLLNYMFFMPVHSEMWRSLLVPDSSYSITLKGQELQIKPFWFTSFLFLISNLLLIYFPEILNWQEWTKMIGTFCRSNLFFLQVAEIKFSWET